MAILAKYHANGDEDDELVRYEYNEICMAIQLEEENSKTSFMDFTKTAGNRRRLLVLITMATGTVRDITTMQADSASNLITTRTGSGMASSPTT